jgi:hypothetical protein
MPAGPPTWMLVHTTDEVLRRVYVWAEMLSCIPLLQYDRRMEHG